MKILVSATSEQYAQLLAKQADTGVELVFFENENETIPPADLYIDLLFNETRDIFEEVKEIPVLVNETIKSNDAIADNYIRFNGWNSFLERDVIEIAEKKNIFFEQLKSILEKVGWKYIVSPDLPGLIAARVIAMIINEGYFALGEGVSSKEEIDTAMKTGTNYPYGPFEWAQKIGIGNIYELLTAMSNADNRYQPAPLLKQEFESV